MTREDFKKIAELLEAHSNKTQLVYNYGIDAIEFTDELNKVISMLMREAFGEIGYDWISWFLYEKESGAREDIRAFDENDNEIIRDIDELYDYVTNLKNKNN
jgi:hypothetical protein